MMKCAARLITTITLIAINPMIVLANSVILYDVSGSTYSTLNAQGDVADPTDMTATTRSDAIQTAFLAGVETFIEQTSEPVKVWLWHGDRYGPIILDTWAEGTIREQWYTQKTAYLSIDKGTKLGEVLNLFTDEGLCEHVAIITDEVADDMDTAKPALTKILQTQKVTVMILDHAPTEEVIKPEFRKLATSPDYSVQTLSPERVIHTLHQGIEDSTTCLSS